ncbi:hypothetical protein C2E25_15680 [Geothermobacter hydrogeniphilus]|uniref:Thioredoxin domain-containing protein n=1 Tax=Geothermobacter hydrogeniphilus TaxID=1969733 RepID=A0A2K2H660_9BACT|nr:hypothetical protein [Geothermobacter hydrogeniphilus]PNU18814.1 hypothetical protein C2E25_15680 [Geothermobacter hydrogeniphilus]
MLHVMLVVWFLFWGVSPALAATDPISFGDSFPEISLPIPAAQADRDYLGLPAGDHFTPSQVPGELLIIEMLNTHCPHCQMQTASYNELFKMIEADPKTRGRIHMLGLAIGNIPSEVEGFRRAFNVPFPVIPDPKFNFWRAIGGTTTPFTIYVRQDRPGKPGVVAGTHLGLNTHYENLFYEFQDLARTDLKTLRHQGARAKKVRSAIEPLLSPEDLEYRVRTAFIGTGGTQVAFRQLDLRSGRRVYMARMRRGNQVHTLFAEVTSRQSICDICHDVHFIYVFDKNARVVGFEPLQLTRWGNVNWNREEVDKMRKRLIGSVLTSPPVFDPQVDAVTAATMTSAIIFDSLGQGRDLLDELREKGLWPVKNEK